MDDATILGRIGELVEEEHRLRAQALSGGSTTDEQRARLQALEESLDQCWDLLRRRRATRAAGGDPDERQPRTREQVERYLQ
ncbi:MAG TPA: DUF2630 family protein [Micromonosporaceae bacterium]|nr:DUF2630 family protein [Micromonosporaceae bacterium]